MIGSASERRWRRGFLRGSLGQILPRSTVALSGLSCPVSDVYGETSLAVHTKSLLAHSNNV